MVTKPSPTSILLYTGRYFDFLEPERCEILVEDVAHALSLTCRFGGHAPWHYSVAQHSVLVSRLVAPEHAYAALMHDAAEAFIGDVVRPIKVGLPSYLELEARVEAVVFERLGVPNPLPPEVKAADNLMLAVEQRELMRNQDPWVLNLVEGPVPDMRLEQMLPSTAEWLFLQRYVELRGHRA